MNLQRYELYECSEPQEVVGDIPGALRRWGVLSLALILAVLLLGSYFFKCPDTLSGSVVIPASVSHPTQVDGRLFLPAARIGEVRVGARVFVRTDAYPESTYGMLRGEVLRVRGVPDGMGLYCVDVRFPNGLETTRGKHLSCQLQLSGTGDVALGETRLLSMLVAPLRQLAQSKDN